MQTWKRVMFTGVLLSIISIIILVLNIFKNNTILEVVGVCGSIIGLSIISISVFIDEED